MSYLRYWKKIIPVTLLFITVIFTGCVGSYNNTHNFLNPPATGDEELSVLKEFGTPSFATTVEDQKIYTFKVRDVKYMVCIGLYEGYDLVVICRDGMVVETKKVPPPKSFSLFYPVPWAVAE